VTAPNTGIGTASGTDDGVEWMLLFGVSSLTMLTLVLARRRRRV
jgi:LPXTG-motif cell wall-anchored protein